MTAQRLIQKLQYTIHNTLGTTQAPTVGTPKLTHRFNNDITHTARLSDGATLKTEITLYTMHKTMGTTLGTPKLTHRFNNDNARNWRSTSRWPASCGSAAAEAASSKTFFKLGAV